jgi:hypothetical protein
MDHKKTGWAFTRLISLSVGVFCKSRR